MVPKLAFFPALAVAAAIFTGPLGPDGREALGAEPPNVPPGHGIQCRCRANGRSYELGEKVCLKTPDGYRIAECRMSQNVTSWALAKDDCMVNAGLDIRLRSMPVGAEAR